MNGFLLIQGAKVSVLEQLELVGFFCIKCLRVTLLVLILFLHLL